MKSSSLFAIVMTLCAVACGDSSGSGGSGAGGGAPASCVSDPFSCPDGQTCWIGNDQATFECLNSGTGDVGDTCQNFVGQPTCKDDLTCLQLQGDTQGRCTPFCDPSDPDQACDEGLQCLNVTLGDNVYNACSLPPEEGGGGSGTGGDAAGGGGASAGGAGGGGAGEGGAGGTGGG